MDIKMKYIAVGRWVDKQTGVRKTKLAEYSGGVSKAGNEYEIVKPENSITIDAFIPAGTIVDFDMNMSGNNGKAASPAVSPLGEVPTAAVKSSKG